MDHSQSITMHYVTPQVIYLHSVLQKLVGEIPDLRKIHADKKGLALAEIEKSRKPDWSYWRELFTVSIEDAIWLTLDLDPRHWRNILRLSRQRGWSLLYKQMPAPLMSYANATTRGME